MNFLKLMEFRRGHWISIFHLLKTLVSCHLQLFWCFCKPFSRYLCTLCGCLTSHILVWGWMTWWLDMHGAISMCKISSLTRDTELMAIDDSTTLIILLNRLLDYSIAILRVSRSFPAEMLICLSLNIWWLFVMTAELSFLGTRWCSSDWVGSALSLIAVLVIHSVTCGIRFCIIALQVQHIAVLDSIPRVPDCLARRVLIWFNTIWAISQLATILYFTLYRIWAFQVQFVLLVYHHHTLVCGLTDILAQPEVCLLHVCLSSIFLSCAWWQGILVYGSFPLFTGASESTDTLLYNVGLGRLHGCPSHPAALALWASILTHLVMYAQLTKFGTSYQHAILNGTHPVLNVAIYWFEWNHLIDSTDLGCEVKVLWNDFDSLTAKSRANHILLS